MQHIALSPDIYHELHFLLDVTLLGILITFVYDNIRILRRVIPHNYLFIALEDLFFWIWTSLRIFALQFYENNGVFRWFSIMGAMVGMMIYKFIFSGVYIKYATKTVKCILHILYKILEFVLRPFMLAQMKTEKQIKKVGKKVKRAGRVLKLRLTSHIKMSKLTLRKRSKDNTTKRSEHCE